MRSNIVPSGVVGIVIRRNKMIKVFYDGKCGLCAKEINHYKEIAPQGIFEWVDVTESPKRLEQYNILRRCP